MEPNCNVSFSILTAKKCLIEFQRFSWFFFRKFSIYKAQFFNPNHVNFWKFDYAIFGKIFQNVRMYNFSENTRKNLPVCLCWKNSWMEYFQKNFVAQFLFQKMDSFPIYLSHTPVKLSSLFSNKMYSINKNLFFFETKIAFLWGRYTYYPRHTFWQTPFVNEYQSSWNVCLGL